MVGIEACFVQRSEVACVWLIEVKNDLMNFLLHYNTCRTFSFLIFSP